MAVYKEVDGVITLVQEDLTQNIIEETLAKNNIELSPCANENKELFKKQVKQESLTSLT
jgi:hypothetical protein